MTAPNNQAVPTVIVDDDAIRHEVERDLEALAAVIATLEVETADPDTTPFEFDRLTTVKDFTEREDAA